jgi:G:T/U-mismatch repair DNA glycosylase
MRQNKKKMKIIKHKFADYKIHDDTEVLIIGTFNPATEKNYANFFYSRDKNFLWQILPESFLEESLKGKEKDDKLRFIEKHKIDFVDLIQEVEIEDGQEINYNDSYIDNKVTKWTDIKYLFQNYPMIKKVCFTRISFGGIPEMKKQIELVKEYCDNNGIQFEYLITPSRFLKGKLEIYKNFLNKN